MNRSDMKEKGASISRPMEPLYYPPMEDEIDLRELFAALWAGKWIILLFVLIASALSVAYALYLPNKYKSEALLAPAAEESQGGLSGLASQFGGLASLAGVSLGGGEADKTALALEVLQSRRFIGSFIERHNLLVPVMAAKGWDPEAGLILDDEMYDAETQKWVRTPPPNRSAVPSLQEAYDKFVELLHVERDKESGFVNLAIEYYDPLLAQTWVELLTKDINEVMRTQDIAEATKSISYLEQQLGKTSVAEMQSMFYELIQKQTTTIMLAEVRQEYAFTTIDPAVVPELKSGPKRALICVLGAMLGLFLGMLVVIIRAMPLGAQTKQ